MRDDTFHADRHAQLGPVLAGVFGALDAPALVAVAEKLHWVSLKGGDTLFRQGDAGDDVFVIVNGRLRTVLDETQGGRRVLEEAGRGATLGELALLTGEARAASVVAMRDSDLVRLPKVAFDALLERHPHAMMRIARAAAMRLRNASRAPSRGSGPATFALVPASAGAPVAGLARLLAGALGGPSHVLHVAAASVDRALGRTGAAQAGEGEATHGAVVAWLSEQERTHRHVMLEADASWTPWTRRCLRQADRVFVVAGADDDPAPGEIEAAMRTVSAQARVELVLVQREGRARPEGTARWLAPRDVAAHHHVRLSRAGDVARLARRMSGHATGLVLGGGGARGFAHIGMLRALAEDRIDVDVVGGTSIGALIAAAHAHGRGIDEMMDLARSFASPAKLLDRTLPLASLMAARKVTALYQHLFGDARIEDLWTPLFTVSSSLTSARAVVHRTGLLWQAVRASTAIPAIFPPLLADDGDVLVDGGVMNNMPLDVMRDWCEGGTVIGVNPMPGEDKRKPYCFGPSLTGWEALKGRLRWFGSTVRAPSILGSVMRATEINSANRMRLASFRALADVLVEPPLGDFPILAFDRYEPIVEIGYRSAREALDAWRPSTPGVAPLA
ncbi:MAG: cyclic nucleotide-binding and patatin-like phospholipase domain-containing protein [Betaproteobacteria bacterium]